MNKSLLYYSGIFLLSFSSAAIAQDKLNVVQQAMRDELERNMKELKAEGYELPFFINYALQDETSWQMSASRGALLNSTETKGRYAVSVRLLMGDYDFNDESLDNNLFSQPQANEISLPVDDDYLGIRRSLWISTDNVYRNASRQLARNKELLKEQGKPLAELPHRSFAKVPVSKVDVSAPEVKFNKEEMEDYVRKVSDVFNIYKQIDNSGVEFVYQRGYRYLVNSEGSVNRVPKQSVMLDIRAGIRTTEGELVFDNMHYNYSHPTLPPIDKVIADVRKMAEGLISSVSSPVFKEEYTGPVLFTGEPVANLFISQFFGGEDNLITSNNIPGLKGYRYESNKEMESKIGKLLFAEGLTVKALPKMKKYGDVELLGSFEVDDEGVVPADETVMIANGILKELGNDRTLTKPGQKANGLGDGPGVVLITYKTNSSANDLKAKLIALAKKEGLDYALMVKGSALQGASKRLSNVYKVYVEDGREELVRQATMSGISQRNFRKIVDASKEVSVHNVGGSGQLASVICPEAILLEELEFNGAGFPTLKETEYVPSPVK